jgi:hypothetical protein
MLFLSITLLIVPRLILMLGRCKCWSYLNQRKTRRFTASATPTDTFSIVVKSLSGAGDIELQFPSRKQIGHLKVQVEQMQGIAANTQILCLENGKLLADYMVLQLHVCDGAADAGSSGAGSGSHKTLILYLTVGPAADGYIKPIDRSGELSVKGRKSLDCQLYEACKCARWGGVNFQYSYSGDSKSWNDHENAAVAWGGHLASITCHEELAHVRGLVRSGRDFFIGGRRKGGSNGRYSSRCCTGTVLIRY